MNRKVVIFLIMCISLMACNRSIPSGEMSSEVTSMVAEVSSADEEETTSIAYEEMEEKKEIFVGGKEVQEENVPFTMQDVYGLIDEISDIECEIVTGNNMDCYIVIMGDVHRIEGEYVIVDGTYYFRLKDKETWKDYEEWALELYDENYVYEVFTPYYFDELLYYVDEEGILYRAEADGYFLPYYKDSIEVRYTSIEDTYLIKVWRGNSFTDMGDWYVYYVRYDEEAKHRLKIMDVFRVWIEEQ